MDDRGRSTGRRSIAGSRHNGMEMDFTRIITKIYRPGGVFTAASTQRRLERALPLRLQLFRPVLALAVAALVLQAGLLLWAGVKPDRPGLVFTTLFPAAWFVAAILANTQKELRAFALAAVFTGLALTAILPIVQHEYPQYGGAVVLTIVLSGLLIGEFYVGVWTAVCIIMQL